MNLQRKPLRLIATLLGLALLANAPVHAQQPQSAILLAPGVLVSAPDQAPVAWVADAQGRVAAVGLDDGAVIWRGPATGLPLAVIDRQLVVLGRPDRAGRLSLHLLDPGDGSVRGGVLGDLPEGVLASPDPQPNRIFEAIADTSSGALKIRWSYVEWQLQGAQLPASLGAGDGRRELSGVVSIDFAANRVEPIGDRGMPAPRTPDLVGAARLAGLDGTQFRAADDAAVQVSSAVPDDLLGTQWRWSLHERSSGRALGSVVLPYANAPFLLRGAQLLWRSEPLTLRQASGDYQPLPARLVAQSMGNGRELWSVDLMDHDFRGTLPP